jgi:hypothetical protein
MAGEDMQPHEVSTQKIAQNSNTHCIQTLTQVLTHITEK